MNQQFKIFIIKKQNKHTGCSNYMRTEYIVVICRHKREFVYRKLYIYNILTIISRFLEKKEKLTNENRNCR